MFKYEKVTMDESHVNEHQIVNTNQKSRSWLINNSFLLLVLIIMTLVMFASEQWSADLRYERSLIEHGQWWRMLSGHLQHLSWIHMGLNCLALLLVWALVGDSHSPLQWFVILLFLAMTSSIILFYYYPDIKWYVGMSGVIHGLLVSGLVAVIVRLREFIPVLVLLGVTCKITWEYFNGSSEYMSQLVGGHIVTEAHMVGALIGIVTGLLFGFSKKH